MNLTIARTTVALLFALSPLAQVAYSQESKDEAPAKAAVDTASESAAVEIDPMDWPSWRGPEQNGISRETGLIDHWTQPGEDEPGENVLWKRPELATRSTPIVMRGKLYTLCSNEPDTPRESEKVVCVDAATGEILWENKFNVFLTDVPKERVGWSCCVGDPQTGRVYAMGVCGYFQCLDGETGETIWARSLSEEFGTLSTYGGRTNVPVVFEDLVIINAIVIGWGEMAVPAHRFIAFNKATGETVWFNGTRLRPLDTTYSSPSVAVLGGQQALVFGSGDGGIWAFQPRTGVPIWNYQFSVRGLNVSPLVDGDTVYMGHSEENYDSTSMGGFCAVNGVGQGDITKSNELWRDKEVMVGKSSPIVVDGRVYAMDDANILYIMDAATGKPVSKKKQRLTGTITRASLLYADGKIYACTTSAWHVLEPTKDGVKIVDRLRFRQGEEVHGSPIVSHGRIYLPTTDNMYCLGKPDAEPAATERPAKAVEDPLSDQDDEAHVQVTPVESLIQPGQTVRFTARVFNARGQFMREASAAEFSVDAGGQIDKQGVFTADSSAGVQAAIVTVKVGDLSGTARVRIIPPLPWRFDFENVPLTPNMKGVKEGEPPVAWVGIRYRHKVREVDGEKVMVKVTTIPKGTRSQGVMGPADLHDYTIQADVRGAIKDEKMPDIGLIAQRYTMDMMGINQKLQIRSWTSNVDRFAKSIPFSWEPDTWYTMKFRASVEDGKAVLKGKVWPRGEDEPDEWTIEAVDEAPNLVGSPGLFGNASDAEIYLDNILVTENE